jgi:hypothetical protein
LDPVLRWEKRGTKAGAWAETRGGHRLESGLRHGLSELVGGLSFGEAAACNARLQPARKLADIGQQTFAEAAQEGRALRDK